MIYQPPKAVIKSGTITRKTGDTTQYSIGDVWSSDPTTPAVPEITGCARVNGGSGTILAANLTLSVAAVLKADVTVYLFDTPFAAMEDNAAFDPSDAEILTCLGKLPFGSVPSANANNVEYDLLGYGLNFVCGAASTSLFWLPVINNVYTPVSAEVMGLRLHILQD